MHTITVSMLGASGVGKTTLLTSMYREFQDTIGATNLQLRPDPASSPILQETLITLEEIVDVYTSDNEKNIMATEGMRAFGFDIGKRGDTPTLHLDFVDYPGEWMTAGDDKVSRLLLNSAVVLIAIDTPAMMQSKRKWNTRYNRPDQIAAMFEHAYENLDQPRLVIFAPIKGEYYLQNEKSAQELQQAVKETYHRLFQLFRSPALNSRVVAVITPVQTMGCMFFSRIEVKNNSPVFRFHKKNPDDAYAPRDCQQPLRYLLRFLLRLHYDERARNWGLFRFLHDWFGDKYLKDAITTFAQGCKTTGGFEVVQGDPWLKIE